MSKKIIVVIVIIIGVAFYGGMVYGKSTTPSMGQFANGQFPSGNQGERGAGMRNVAGSGFTAGEIILKDATSVTIKMQDGRTKIALIATSTQVTKSSSGALSDLVVGTNITITGTSNSDGSITAQSVQIRPAGLVNVGVRNSQ